MPFLGFGNYAKPGPGVRKDEEEKSVWLKFFIVFKRRLSKFMQLNLIFMLPILGVAALMFCILFLPVPRYAMQFTLGETIFSLKLWELYVVPMPLMLLSPFVGGLMVVSRRLANEEYAFVWSEYWKGVKENWKQFLANGIFLYVMYFLLSFSFIYYSGNLSDNFLSFIPYAMIILVTVLLVFSQYYVSVMIVSVNLKLTHIYKNALIFAIMGLGRNLLLTVIFAALVVLLWMAQIMGLTLLIALAVIILLLFSFIAYTTSYLTYPLVKRYIIDPFENKDIVKNAPEVQPSTDENFDYLQDELDGGEENNEQYVYVNGKLVKRDSLNQDEEEQIFRD